MTDSYAKQKMLEDAFVGDVTPVMSTIDILSSLKLLDQVEGINDENVKQIVNEETKYLKAAMQALNENPLFRDKFGSGFNGAMQLSGLLKSHHSKMVYDHMMNTVIKADVRLKDIEQYANKRNRGDPWGGGGG